MKRVSFRLLLLLLLLLLSANTAGAVGLAARVEPEIATIGDRLKYEITVTGAGKTELPQTLENPSPFELLGTTTEQKGEVKKIIFTLTVFKTGTLKLPPYSITAVKNGKATTFAAPSVSVEIHSVLTPDDKEPRLADIEKEMDAPVEPKEYLLPVAIALAAIALLAGLYYYFKKRKPKAPLPPPPNPPLLPYQAALKEMERIRNERLYEAGRVKEHFSGVSDALRGYLFAEYGLDAPEKTTDELERSWPPLLEGERAAVFNILRVCDAVKFAKASPSADEAARALDEAHRIVRHSPKVKSNVL